MRRPRSLAAPRACACAPGTAGNKRVTQLPRDVVSAPASPRAPQQAREWLLKRPASSSSTDLQYVPHFAGKPCAPNGTGLPPSLPQVPTSRAPHFPFTNLKQLVTSTVAPRAPQAPAPGALHAPSAATTAGPAGAGDNA